jgi:hypothetical protein
MQLHHWQLRRAPSQSLTYYHKPSTRPCNRGISPQLCHPESIHTPVILSFFATTAWLLHGILPSRHLCMAQASFSTFRTHLLHAHQTQEHDSKEGGGTPTGMSVVELRRELAVDADWDVGGTSSRTNEVDHVGNIWSRTAPGASSRALF